MPMYVSSGVEDCTLAPVKVQLGLYPPASDDKSASSGKKNESLGLTAAEHLVVLQFACYLADTSYNLL